MKTTLISIATGAAMLATAATSASAATSMFDAVGCAYQVSNARFQEAFEDFLPVFVGPAMDDENEKIGDHLLVVILKSKTHQGVVIAMHNLSTDMVCGLTSFPDQLGVFDKLLNGTIMNDAPASPAPRKPNERDI